MAPPSGVRSHLVEEYRLAWSDAQAGATAKRIGAQHQLVQTERKIEGLVLPRDGMYRPWVKAKMQDLEAPTSHVGMKSPRTQSRLLCARTRLTAPHRERITNLAAVLVGLGIKASCHRGIAQRFL